jgi:predicted transcriptional regulator
MASKTRTIELDEATAAALKERADERGVTVPDLLAGYLNEDHAPVDVDADQVAELDRRWSTVQAGQSTVRHEKVVRWLETWGTPTFEPWRDR